MASIKVNRALRTSTIGQCPGSANDMLAAIPTDVIAALPSRLLAQLLDADWRLAQQSKALANAEAIAEGAIWDAKKAVMVELA